MITLGTACSGIGGTELAALLSGADYAPRWSVEIAEHQARVLERRVSGTVHRDVYATGAHNLEPVDVYAAGFPCQPFSVAGRRGGEKDPRNLWPEIARHIAELEPRVVVLENVPGLRNPHALGEALEESDEVEPSDLLFAGDLIPAYLGTVLGDLSDLGYVVQWDGRSAASIGAHHRRDRLWIVGRRMGVADFDAFSDEPRHPDPREIGRWDGTYWTSADLFDQHVVMKWPRAGFALNGVAFEIATASPATSTGWVWATPNAFDAVPDFGKRAEASGRHAMSLRHQAPDAMWATTRAEDSEQTGAHGDVADTLTSQSREALYQTPTVGDATGGRASKGKDRPDDGGLRKQVEGALWTTARASESEMRTYRQPPSHAAGRHGKMLQGEAFNALWATVSAGDHRDRGGDVPNTHRREGLRQLNLGMEAGVAIKSRSGLLNPRWVEALMGYPPGWTDLTVAEGVPFDAVQRAWASDAYRIGDLEGTNPDYAQHWLWHPILGDVELPIAPREKQTKDRLISLGNAWVPQVAAPIFRRIARALEPR